MTGFTETAHFGAPFSVEPPCANIRHESLIAAVDKRIRAAVGKAIREVKRQAALNNTKLVVAGEMTWSVPK